MEIIMSPFLKIALLLDLVAVWLEKAFPSLSGLPITGDHFGQLAILVVLGLILEEIGGFLR
ncbi:hypothetical protein ELH21_09390 [Rhizobium leguminosarum]|uniref:hypothetical protein n=1 Tax=Rhizobium leguminosarum TaxID=384 RepID=UPI001031C9D9|nr:hypothetical protein [Rhizobium leguminosarum]TBD04592.1 hypothetical protein ELH21_09390 [Rhizobium leguminosarum]